MIKEEQESSVANLATFSQDLATFKTPQMFGLFGLTVSSEWDRAMNDLWMCVPNDESLTPIVCPVNFFSFVFIFKLFNLTTLLA